MLKAGSSDLAPVCNDTNECLNTTSPACKYNQNCVNTIGSYICNCKPGYSLIISNNTCVDINECDQSPCSVNATCVNTEGSFLCPCKQYYKEDSNGKCLFQERSK